MQQIIRRMLMMIAGVVFLFLVLYGYLFFNVHQKSSKDLELKQCMQERDDVLEISELMYKIEFITMTQVSVGDSADVQESQKKLDTLFEQADRLMKSSFKVFGKSRGKETFHALYSAYTSYKEQQKIAFSIAAGGSLYASRYYVSVVMRGTLDTMGEHLQDLEQMKEEQINEIKMTQVSENRREAVILIVMSIIAVAVVCVSLLLIRRMSSSLMTQFGDEMEEQQARMIEMQQRTIEGMADLVESRDELTGDHVKSTAYYAGIIAGQLLEDGHYTDEIDENYIQQLVHFAPLHDMGKIVVSDNILLKPGKLTGEEFEQMKLHASMGGQIIRSILDGVEAPWHVEMACNIATHHHERWDGHGYPDGLSQMQIPLCARIMSVADVFDALISPRIYKPAFSLEQSYAIIQEGAGKQFDPVIVEAFMKLRPRIDRYLQEKEEKLEKSS